MTNEKNKNAEVYQKIIQRIDILSTLSIFVDEIRGESIDEVSYLRIKAGLDFMLYELNHMLDFGLHRPLAIDDISAKNIVDMAKPTTANGTDILIKKGIDVEVDYIYKFVKKLLNSPDKALSAKEMIEFAEGQKDINKKIEKLFRYKK